MIEEVKNSIPTDSLFLTAVLLKLAANGILYKAVNINCLSCTGKGPKFQWPSQTHFSAHFIIVIIAISPITKHINKPPARTLGQDR